MLLFYILEVKILSHTQPAKDLQQLPKEEDMEGWNIYLSRTVGNDRE